MNKYEKQGNDFAKKHGISMKVIRSSYCEHPSFFDKTNRWVFNINLLRDGKVMKIVFGQSIAEGRNIPSIYDILSGLTKSEVGSFNDFCSEFGYDAELNRSMKTYKAVKREWEDVNHMFGDILDELDKIM